MPTDEHEPFLHVTLQHRQGPVALDLAFALLKPWTVLFGPSGSGKSTILRAIAGHLQPRSGRIVHRGEPQLDTAIRLFVPPHRRAIRSAGQTARLFPLMTVEQNLRYGTSSIANASSLVNQLLDLFQIEPLAAKLPHALSGGERQRVSVARAIASAAALGNALLLLDEPFTGLDFTLRDSLATELPAWLRQRRIPVLSVTHDVAEAFLIDAEVLRLEAGRITRQGPVREVLAIERRRILDQLL